MPKSNSVAAKASSSLSSPAEMVQEYPLSTAMVVFGLGLGLGVLVSQAICSSMIHMAPPPTMAERWGKQFYDTLSHAVPDSVSRRFA